mmetsp:Transcript_38735/g.58910  ORF Transcript_38735/g.58910 Transcript_38735/m.58910 type:complete len:165 (-) Transcript_38735:1658-2152(-)
MLDSEGFRLDENGEKMQQLQDLGGFTSLLTMVISIVISLLMFCRGLRGTMVKQISYTDILKKFENTRHLELNVNPSSISPGKDDDEDEYNERQQLLPAPFEEPRSHLRGLPDGLVLVDDDDQTSVRSYYVENEDGELEKIKVKQNIEGAAPINEEEQAMLRAKY